MKERKAEAATSKDTALINNGMGGGSIKSFDSDPGSFMEFLGHRKYGGDTFLNALLPKQIAPLIHKQVVNQWRVVDNEADYLRFVNAYSGRAQVYIGLNPVRDGLERHSKDEDVTHLCNIYIDLDLEKPERMGEDVAAGYPHKATDYAAEEGDLERLKPHITAVDMWLKDHGFKAGYHDRTGNGYRWILPIPAIDLEGYTKDDRDNLQAKVKAFLKQVSDECGIVPGCGAHIDSTTDFRRITGVPGTLNLKLETEARKNRIREPFRGAERDEDVALCQCILDTEITQPEPHRESQPTGNTAGYALEHWRTQDPKLKSLYEGDISGYPSRSEAEMALATKLVFYNFNASEIEDILLSAGIGKAAEEKRKGHTTYIKSSIKKAFELETKRVETAPEKTPVGRFDVSPNEFLVGERKAFDTNKFAKWILNESDERFVTLIDNEQVYRYSDGVYVTSGEAFIKQMTERVMNGFKVTKNAANEIIGHVQRRTYVEREEFDNDLDVINLKNGLYHIKSGEFEQHTPDYLSLSKMDIKYDPDAKCETIDRFIKDAVKPERVDAIYEIAGYTVLPEKRLKRGVIFVGEPDTGKSTMISTISAFVGENHISDVSPVAFGNDNHASFDLYGKLLNRIDDLGTTPIEDTGVLKSVVSSAPIRANQKYGTPFSFIPKALVLFGCNQVPACSDKNMRDKFDILMFENVHSGKSIDPELPKKLTTDREMSGLFNKAMVAVKTAIENRTFTGSYTLYDRQKDYEYHSNPLARFVDECCDLSDQEAITDKKIFRKIYIEWSKQHNFTVVPVGKQTTYLQDKGVMLRRLGPRDDRSECYVGIIVDPCQESVMAVSKKKPTIFPEQEAVLKNGVTCHDSILLVTSKKKEEEEKRVESRMVCDTRHEPKNDSKRANHVMTRARTISDTDKICCKCGCELGGQTFQGPAGLGLICADCQAELDRTSGHIERTDEQMLNLINGAIYRLGFSKGIHEFDIVRLLDEIPKGTGATTEKIKELLNDHAGELKIERTDGGKWRRVKA